MPIQGRGSAAILALGQTTNNPIRTAGADVTVSNGAGVASAFVQLLAPVSVDNYLVACAMAQFTATGNQFVYFDFALGAAGAENVKLMVPFVASNNASAVNNIAAFPIPLYVPANTRLSVRAFTVNGSTGVYNVGVLGMLARADDFKRVS